VAASATSFGVSDGEDSSSIAHQRQRFPNTDEERFRLRIKRCVPLLQGDIQRRLITDIDYSAGEALKELHEDLAKIGVVLAMARVSEQLHKDLERLGLVDVIGRDKIFDSRGTLLETYRRQSRP
jgi:MFS superfamily sulfate permease-like transporter